MKTKEYQCYKCNKKINESETFWVYGEPLCEDCYHKVLQEDYEMAIDYNLIEAL